MTREEAFLLAIRDEPDDRTHRHVFADWLEDQGDPRAELMRGILAYQECLPDGCGDSFQPFHLAVPARLVPVGVHHGVMVATEGLLSGETVAATGWVTRVGIRARSREEFRNSLRPWSEGTPKIELTVSCLGDEARLLADDPILANVTGLRLTDQTMDDAVLAAILASPYLTNLETLQLGARQAGPETLDVLANVSFGGRLRSLFLGFLPQNRSHFARLFRAPWVPGLQALRLLVSSNDESGLRLLAGTNAFRNLQVLELDAPGRVTCDVSFLGGAAFWPGLRGLSLGIPSLDATAAQTLLDLLQPGRLRALRLMRHQAGNLLQAISECPGLHGLTHLTLGGLMPKLDPIRSFGSSPHLRRLISLDLRAEHVDDRRIAGLADWPDLDRLRVLRLFHHNLTDAGLATLAGISELRGLRSLDLAWSATTDAGFAALAAAPQFAGLLHLVLTSTAWSNDATAARVALFPQVWNATV